MSEIQEQEQSTLEIFRYGLVDLLYDKMDFLGARELVIEFLEFCASECLVDIKIEKQNIDFLRYYNNQGYIVAYFPGYNTEYVDFICRMFSEIQKDFRKFRILFAIVP